MNEYSIILFTNLPYHKYGEYFSIINLKKWIFSLDVSNALGGGGGSEKFFLQSRHNANYFYFNYKIKRILNIILSFCSYVIS